MYSFQPLISSEGYLPPVIAEAKDVAHITNEQIRTANRAYDIVVPARFVSNPPTRKSYLLTGLMAQRIELPEPAAMPKDGKQRDIWKKAVALGWSDGRQKLMRYSLLISIVSHGITPACCATARYCSRA